MQWLTLMKITQNAQRGILGLQIKLNYTVLNSSHRKDKILTILLNMLTPFALELVHHVIVDGFKGNHYRILEYVVPESFAPESS